ncbi:MAG: alpha-L-rhamnosidase N-terminal domain-containing protein, partial [Candidatus Hydrogenedentota bacterium]
MEIRAKWIWKKQRNYNPYNQTLIARKRFSLRDIREAHIKITADSYYRLYINGAWVNDGPCRSWPWHYQYDVINAAPYLRKGENRIKIIARYFGVGTFHQIPVQAGLLAQLDVLSKNGKKTTIASDRTWEVAEARTWRPNTPKISVQMEPAELYDARLEKRLRFSKAVALFGAHEGPWKHLHPRDCALLTREPFPLRRFIEANVVASDWRRYTFPMARLAHPGLIEANHHVNSAGAVATCIVAKRKKTITVEGFGMDITVNGKRDNRGRFQLRAGDNFLLATTQHVFNHQYKETGVRFVEPTDITLQNPVDSSHENPWVYVPCRDVDYVDNDIAFLGHSIEERDETQRAIERNLSTLKKQARDIPSFLAHYDDIAQCLPREAMLLEDPHPQFEMRRVVHSGARNVAHPRALMHENGEVTVVKPSRRGDIELVYDLGEQNIG